MTPQSRAGLQPRSPQSIIHSRSRSVKFRMIDVMVRRVRFAIESAQAHPKYLRTVPGFGYCFYLPENASEINQPTGPRQSKHAAATGISVLAKVFTRYAKKYRGFGIELSMDTSFLSGILRCVANDFRQLDRSSSFAVSFSSFCPGSAAEVLWLIKMS